METNTSSSGNKNISGSQQLQSTSSHHQQQQQQPTSHHHHGHHNQPQVLPPSVTNTNANTPTVTTATSFFSQSNSNLSGQVTPLSLCTTSASASASSIVPPHSPSPILVGGGGGTSANSSNSQGDTANTSTLMAGPAPSGPGPCTLTKRESYKDRKKSYQKAKKKVAEELLTTISDPTVVVAQDWLKIRGSLKGWTKVWCELKPGLILLYKTPKTHKSGIWIGTILLNSCEVIERPSKKNGFCFKLFHPLEQSIWASRGPKGETFGAFFQPLPTCFLIFRAPSEESGRQWMEAIELSYRCSSMLVRNSISASGKQEFPSFLLTRASNEPIADHSDDVSPPPSATMKKMNESEMEKHFKDHDLEDDEEFHSDHTDPNDTSDPYGHSRGLQTEDSDSDADVTPSQLARDIVTNLNDPNIRKSLELHTSSNTIHQSLTRPSSGRRASVLSSDDEPVIETPYMVNAEPEEFGSVGDQYEEVAEENKSLLWSLIKQVRPGMDLSKVVLPTFILEPRSFLEKLSDYYYHCDIISSAAQEEDPLSRMKLVAKWYLSGFYKKPKGLKKPYNPILGESFRCYWSHPETGSRTFYIAEQVSHHPPVSAFHVTNRKEGFCIHGSILAKSKFYGNSVSAVLDGTARLTLLTRGEDYVLTMPYAHCKGILMGTLSLELGGKVEIRCDKTGYTTELEFKLKPFLGGNDYSNLVVGKIKLGKETLATIEGHWDSEIIIKDKKLGSQNVLWQVSSEVKGKRLKRYTVPLENQEEFESERLWLKVSNAITRGDQVAATEEKTILEDIQRRAAAERRVKVQTWLPRLFIQDLMTGEWIYKHIESRPWDPRTDVLQFERDFCIQTKTRHKTPVVAVRTNSVVSIETAAKAAVAAAAVVPLSKQSPILSSASGATVQNTISGVRHRHHQRMKSIASKGSRDSSPDVMDGPKQVLRSPDKGSSSVNNTSSVVPSSDEDIGKERDQASNIRDIRMAIRELRKENARSMNEIHSLLQSIANSSSMQSDANVSTSGGAKNSSIKKQLTSLLLTANVTNRRYVVDVVFIVIISVLTQLFFNALLKKLFA